MFRARASRVPSGSPPRSTRSRGCSSIRRRSRRLPPRPPDTREPAKDPGRQLRRPGTGLRVRYTARRMKTGRPPTLSAGVIVVRQADSGWLFLMLRAYRNWDFPKGLVESGEDPLAAARREVTEE